MLDLFLLLNDAFNYVWNDTFLEKIHLFIHDIFYPTFAWATVNTMFIDDFVYQCFFEISHQKNIFDTVADLVELKCYDAYCFVVSIDAYLVTAFNWIFNI